MEEIKKNEEVGIRYMNAFEEKMWERREGREEGEKIGEKRGKKSEQREIARRMVEKNLDLVLIKEMTGLTEQELKVLKKRN